MLFSELPLDHKLVKALTVQQLTETTEIQSQAIPQALLGKDILASSKTGSGKTLAYLVPAIHKVYRSKSLSKKDPRVLIVAPTRELAKQVFVELKKLIPASSGKPALLIGGENFNDQVKLLKRYPDFVVGTPGRIADHIEDRSLFLEGLELLILDEADRILDLGFTIQLDMINQSANHRKRQTMLFSATFDHIDLAQISDRILSAPHKITIDDQHGVHSDIQQAFYYADNLEHKEKLIRHFLHNEVSNEQAIIFTATRDDTERMAIMLTEHDLKAGAIHGEMLQSQRNQIIADFTSQKFRILMTTDLASRGLDIPAVRLVLNMDLPIKATEYVHRVGRTGRAGIQGRAISLVSKKDWKSFLLLKQFLTTTPEFLEVSELPATFKGLRQHNSNNKNKSDIKQVSKGKKKASPIKKAKFNALEGDDVGHLPMKKKARTNIVDTDEDESDE